MSSVVKSKQTLGYLDATSTIQTRLTETPNQAVAISLDADTLRQIISDIARLTGLRLPYYLISSIELTACYRLHRYGARLTVTLTVWRNDGKADEQEVVYPEFSPSYTVAEWEVFRNLTCWIAGTRYFALATQPRVGPSSATPEVAKPQQSAATASTDTFSSAPATCTLTVPVTEGWAQRIRGWCTKLLRHLWFYH
ncbi:MAG TPA: hypothetical protein VNG90_05225 [Candidatus Acidoferrum sp.]|nr:hypothetical protein [Candidatus Acidoferrum sp.]